MRCPGRYENGPGKVYVWCPVCRACGADYHNEGDRCTGSIRPTGGRVEAQGRMVPVFHGPTAMHYLYTRFDLPCSHEHEGQTWALFIDDRDGRPRALWRPE